VSCVLKAFSLNATLNFTFNNNNNDNEDDDHDKDNDKRQWTIPTFSFLGEAGPHLPTLEVWKAELAWNTEPKNIEMTFKVSNSSAMVTTKRKYTVFIGCLQ